MAEHESPRTNKRRRFSYGSVYLGGDWPVGGIARTNHHRGITGVSLNRFACSEFVFI